MSTRKRQKYEKEFKEMIVSLVNSGQSRAAVSKDYHLDSGMVGRWVRESKTRIISVPFGTCVSIDRRQFRKRLSNTWIGTIMDIINIYSLHRLMLESIFKRS